MGPEIPAMVRNIISKEMIHLLPKVPVTVLRFVSFEESPGLLTDHFPEHRNSEGWELMWFNPNVFKRMKKRRRKPRAKEPGKRRLRNKKLRGKPPETGPSSSP